MSAGSVSAWRGPTIFCRAARTASRFIAPNLEEPPRARFPPRRAAKDGGDFDMRGKAELVKRRHGLDAKAALDENARVAGECRRVARDGRDERQRGGGEFARLPERGGSISAASNESSSSARSARRKRSRVSATSLRKPVVVAAAWASAATAAGSASAVKISCWRASLKAKA